MTKKEYFTEDELDKLADYIGMDLSTFLQKRKEGKIGFRARPLNPTPVFHRADIDRWLANNRPVASMSPDPAGVLTYDPNRKGDK